MPYITKLVMKGFKSFARETAMNLDKNMNVIVGPNGSGKSNVTDALCFVLGRLSIKSLRAAKASNLIFAGNKYFKKANEAYVEITFDNSDKIFALENKEIVIRRILKKNGQSIYKINNDVKTRQEVLELLAQAGIDPHGFNLVLQGEIERLVKMPADERRRIIEEVAGISVYEMRKNKSLKELEKTEERLKQINAVLRERTNYLKNLENEREQALKFKRLEETIKNCKASIINKNIQERKRESGEINKKIESKSREIEREQELIEKTQKEIDSLNEKINIISKTIQKSSGIEQDALMEEISYLKQEIAGMSARKENFENQLVELDRRNQNLKDSIKTMEKEITDMTKEKGKNKKKDLEEKKQKLEELDELKRKSYLLKSNLNFVNSQIEDKKKQIQRTKNESNFILNNIEKIESEIKTRDNLDKQRKTLDELRKSISLNKEKSSRLQEELFEKEKIKAIQNQIIKEAKGIISEVSKLDICPLCRTKITPEHINEVIKKSELEILDSEKIINKTEGEIKEIKKETEEIKEEASKETEEVNKRESDIIKMQAIESKKEDFKRVKNQEEILNKEINAFEEKRRDLENKSSSIKLSEEQYENLRLEINELQRSEEKNLGFEISSKQRELERIKIAIKQIMRDKDSISEDLKDMNEDLEEKHLSAEEKEEQLEDIKKKYEKMFIEKNNMQDKTRILESNLMKHQNEKRILEHDISNFNITKAQINAKEESLEQELKEFQNIELINLPIEKLKERLTKCSEVISRIGSVNMRALEVYADIKADYEKIREKVEQLEKEKQEIIKIMEQIDRKKKKIFMNTLNEINILFSRNFTQLSAKGIVFLEPQNKQDIFEAGLDIIVKVGTGKYFDVTSLSGGEQCLVALSLIFAIQEYKPYCFYIFDEIDAALDKRNSEKLAYLLKKYIKEGQYIIITHNDALISESSNVLYGVSMQEGVSKILSLEV